MDPSIRTAYLGQFEEANAERIAEALDEEGIAWSAKSFGRLTRLLFMGDWGVRLYVDASRVDEGKAIAKRVTTEER